ncbi:MAG: (2Fe-2S)-binding protein [Rhodospirillaceae bacterium]|nr:(2Fe-2S)-binding protein [Rhodospirillaceae bacterium]
MLSREDNERITRVGAGTPGGEMLRRYWWPVVLSSEIPESGREPVRARLLGEDLLLFKDTEGRVGLVDAYCPHRRAPLFFGRNEDCGLRCVYHGWKFDVDGNCTDLPSEPVDSPMKAKVKLTSYPTHEAGGVLWAYLGPAETMPGAPDFEWTRVPKTHQFVSKTYEECNYLQALEGGLDTSHSSFLHRNNMKDKSQLRSRDGAPSIEVHETDYGYYYVSQRNLGDDRSYARVYHYVMPCQQMRPNTQARNGSGRAEVPKFNGHIWVPIDDEQTMVYNWMCGFDESVPLTQEFIDDFESIYGRGQEDMIPGTARLKKNLSNDYLIDRDLQRNGSFTGITGINTQDFALQEGMGPIVDRSKEYLGTSDKAIISMRKLMLNAVKEVEQGNRPAGADPATHRDLRPHDDILPAGTDWREAYEDALKAKW